MTNTNTKHLRFEDFKVKFNEASVEYLFRQYEKTGFLYPEKKALLAPHIQSITKNWKTLLNGKEDMLWILTSINKNNNNFSSVSVWKQSNAGMQAQHLVSDGNPFLSLKVMLATQYKAEHHFTKHELNSSQNWFRPNNRYAYRVFASMYDKLGPNKASLRLFQYLNMPLQKIEKSDAMDFEIIPVTGVNLEFINFVRQQYGEVFVQAEELNQSDILLEKMNIQYQQYDLQRYRKVVQIRCKQTRKIIAAAIVNRAPLGINFSFLENKAYYILAEDLSITERIKVLKVINGIVNEYYTDFPLKAIPIVTDKGTSEALQSIGANYLRAYMQSIWMRSGFALWFNHIYSFLQKIESRQLRRKVS